MSVAFLSAQRSKDPNKQVVACVVGEISDSGVGYNGFLAGARTTLQYWSKKSENDDVLETKYAYVCHAEMNAIMNKNSASVMAGSLLSPCIRYECAKLIIQAGIEEVVYYEGKISGERNQGDDGRPARRDDPIYAAANRLLRLAGVRVRQRPSVAVEVTYLDDDESSDDEDAIGMAA